MSVKLTVTHDRLALVVTFDKQKVRLGLSRSRAAVSSEGLQQDELKRIGAWYLPLTSDGYKGGYYNGTFMNLFNKLEEFAKGCTSMKQFIAGPHVHATVSRLADELMAKVKPAKPAVTSEASGKYDHLYKPGMTAKEKQAIRAKARRGK